MKTVQAQRSVEMENVVNHAWASGYEQSMYSRSRNIARMLPFLAPSNITYL